MKKRLMLTVGEAARMLGVSVKTLQRWDAGGKLIAQRTQSGRRLYDEAVLLPLLTQKATVQNEPTIKVTRLQDGFEVVIHNENMVITLYLSTDEMSKFLTYAKEVFYGRD